MIGTPAVRKEVGKRASSLLKLDVSSCFETAYARSRSKGCQDPLETCASETNTRSLATIWPRPTFHAISSVSTSSIAFEGLMNEKGPVSAKGTVKLTSKNSITRFAICKARRERVIGSFVPPQLLALN